MSDFSKEGTSVLLREWRRRQRVGNRIMTARDLASKLKEQIALKVGQEAADDRPIWHSDIIQAENGNTYRQLKVIRALMDYWPNREEVEQFEGALTALNDPAQAYTSRKNPTHEEVAALQAKIIGLQEEVIRLQEEVIRLQSENQRNRT